MKSIQLNNQPTEAATKNDGKVISYIKTWKTIQGEGPLIGTPSVFVRLAGCNLQCPWCDTNYTVGRKEVLTQTLIHEIKNHGFKQVVLTGGEPFRQNITLLCELLLYNGMHVQIETNGTMWCDHFERVATHRNVRIVCSPKTPKLHPSIAKHAHAYKYVVEDGFIGPDGFPTKVLGKPCIAAPPPEFMKLHKDRIFIQPLDTGEPVANQKHAQAAIDTAFKHGYRFCPQVHKIFGLE